MADFKPETWFYVWLNPDGSFTTSAFRAHWDAVPYKVYHSNLRLKLK